MLEFGFDMHNLNSYSTEKTTIETLPNNEKKLADLRYEAIRHCNKVSIEKINRVEWFYPIFLSASNFKLPTTHSISTNNGEEKEVFLVNALSLLVRHRLVPKIGNNCHSRAAPIFRERGWGEIALTSFSFKNCSNYELMLMLESFWEKYNHIQNFSNQFNRMILNFFDSQTPGLYHNEKFNSLVGTIELIWWLFFRISEIESQNKITTNEKANISTICKIMCDYYCIHPSEDWITYFANYRNSLTHMKVHEYKQGDGEEFLWKPYQLCQILMMGLFLGKEYAENDNYFFATEALNSHWQHRIDIKKPLRKKET